MIASLTISLQSLKWAYLLNKVNKECYLENQSFYLVISPLCGTLSPGLLNYLGNKNKDTVNKSSKL